MGEGQDRIQVAASPEAVWKVIADSEGHAQLAGSSEILAIRFQGPSGARRLIDRQGQSRRGAAR